MKVSTSLKPPQITEIIIKNEAIFVDEIFHLLKLTFFFFLLFRAAPAAYGGSQARGLMGVAAASLHHSHSNAGSEPHLEPTPQLTAVSDP